MKPAISPERRRALLWAGCCFALLLAAPAGTIELPEEMPAPLWRPDDGPALELQSKPAPEPWPAVELPRPTPRPDQPEADAGAPVENPPPGERHDPAAMPTGELACRSRLRALGVRFEEQERLTGEGGCLIAHPIAVSAFSPKIAVEPEAILNCAAAEAAAKFVTERISPDATETFGSPVAEIGQASTYVCRPRHGQTKMSEHAFGNAIDFASFKLEDGTLIEVKAYGPADLDRQDFLRRIRAAACGPFTTVLGPGADADHAYHLHLDLQPRRRSGTYCK